MKKEKLDWGDFPFRFFALLSVILGGAYILRLKQAVSEAYGKMKNVGLATVAFIGVLLFFLAGAIGYFRSLKI